MRKSNVIITEKQHQQYALNEMARGKGAFRPLKHKETKESFTDLDYLLLLGEYVQNGEAEWKKAHPHRDFKIEGIAPEVQKFAQIIYKGYNDGISKSELKSYISDSIDLDS